MYGSLVVRLVRHSKAMLAFYAAAARRDRLPADREPEGLHPWPGPRLHHSHTAASRRLFAGTHHGDRQGSRTHRARNSGRVASADLCRLFRSDADDLVEFGGGLCRAQAVRRADEARPDCRLDPGGTDEARGPHRRCEYPRRPAAFGLRPRQRRRFLDAAGGSRRSRHGGSGQGDQRSRRRGQRHSRLRRRLHDVLGGYARRSRSISIGSGPRCWASRART